MKKESEVFCLKLILWSIVGQKSTNILIFYIFEYCAEYGAECSAESGAKFHAHYSLFSHNQVFFRKKIQLKPSLHKCECVHFLFTYNPYSKQSVLLVVKKNEARIVSLCAKHRFVLESMRVRVTYVRVRFRMLCDDFESAVYEQMDSSFQSRGQT